MLDYRDDYINGLIRDQIEHGNNDPHETHSDGDSFRRGYRKATLKHHLKGLIEEYGGRYKTGQSRAELDEIMKIIKTL